MEKKKIQRQAARFITGDYRSREPGCVSAMLTSLELPPLQTRRKHQRLTTFYKIVEDRLPALPPHSFLTPVATTRRRIKPTRYEGYKTTNIQERQTVNHSRGYIVPSAGTEQYRNSFFVRTTMEWSHLSEVTVKSSSVMAFSATLTESADPSPTDH